VNTKEKVEERQSLSYKPIPLPLVKGKGIKGIGLPNKNLKGGEVDPETSHFGVDK